MDLYKKIWMNVNQTVAKNRVLHENALNVITVTEIMA